MDELHGVLDAPAGVAAHEPRVRRRRIRVRRVNTARPLLLRVEPGDKQDLKSVEQCILRFAEVDPTSEAFRYPVTREGGPSLPEDLFNINLRQVRDVVERMSGFFDAVATQLSAYLDYKWDAEEEGRAIEAEMRREMEAEYHGW